MAATILTEVPELQPSRWKIVVVARTAVMAREVSQPIEVIHAMTPGILLPWVPKAARERTIVGADPRLPAMAMMPQKPKETMTPMRVAAMACQKDTPNPNMKAP